MPMLDSLKDENGKLKKPILISLIGAGGLLGYLMLSKGSSGSTTTSAGQSSPLTPDLTGLQTALQSLGQNSSNTGGGQSGSSPSLDPPATYDPSTGVSTGNVIPSQGTLPVAPTPNVSVSTPVVTSPNMAQPTVPQAPGSSGSQGGGGGGTGQVIQSIAKAPTVYGGVTVSNNATDVALANAYNAAKTNTSILSSPSLISNTPKAPTTIMTSSAGTKTVVPTTLANLLGQVATKQVGTTITQQTSTKLGPPAPVTGMNIVNAQTGFTTGKYNAPTVIAKQPVKGKSNTTKL